MSFSVKQSRGFTLLEMIITMVVVGILFLGIAGFVEFGARGYVDSVARTKIQNQAQFVIEKMSRELRHAIPNSIQTSLNGQCVSFYPITFSGFYHLDEKLGNTEFVVGNINQYPHHFANSERLIINPSRQQDLEGRRAISLAGISSVVDAQYFTLNQLPEQSSVGQRLYIYNSANKVNYCITTSGQIERNGIRVATNIEPLKSSFTHLEASLLRSALVRLNLVFNQVGEASNFQHDVQVLNVP
jgi:MSHA biogenesis protein MshO